MKMLRIISTHLLAFALGWWLAVYGVALMLKQGRLVRPSDGTKKTEDAQKSERAQRSERLQSLIDGTRERSTYDWQ